MLNIKRLPPLCTFMVFFFTTYFINAQQINQFDANKQRTGVWEKYYDNQNIRYQGQFKKGKEIGVFKFYDENGSQFPSIIKNFRETTDSVAVEFYLANGKLQSKGFFIEKNRVGKWQYFFQDGKIMSEELYHRGKLAGKLINFYPNGKPTEITHYKNGLKEGISQKFSSDGILIEEVTYENNVLNGLAKFFELNGNLREKGIYKNGKKFGKWDFYIDGEITDEKEIEDQKRFINKQKD
ncbi:MAG: toxin-antitoxin system YwqK family antitoxin [Polaribacter sp.]|nr:toxin-antitoxin system YwqK family antitoxin [Polaribacter sp.]